MLVFLDTNILVHFQPINLINWSEMSGSVDNSIVLLPIVIQELDAHKYSERNRLRERSKKALKSLKSITEEKKIDVIYPNVFYDERVIREAGYDSLDNDDILIWSLF